MTQETEPRIGGYPVVGSVELDQEYLESAEYQRPTKKDPFIVEVEGVEAETAILSGRTQDGHHSLVKLLGCTENIEDPNLHFLDPIIKVPTEKVKKRPWLINN